MNQFISKELDFILLCTALFILLPLDKPTIYRSSFSVLAPVLLLSFIGLSVGFLSLRSINRDFYRDIFLFFGVIPYFFGGALLSKYVKDLNTFFLAFTLIVALSSVMHIWLVVTTFGHYDSLLQYRRATGTTNLNEAILLGLFFARIFNKNLRKLIPSIPLLTNFFILIILISFTLYFSRTMIITLGVLVFFLSEYITIRYFFSNRNRHLPFATFLVIAMVFLSGLLISFLPPNAYVTTLVDKFERIPDEVFWNSKDSYAAALADINDNWRGYEASQGVKKFNRGTTLQKFAGFGFGSVVDLELIMKLADKDYEKVPILHNGYVLLLVKCGVAGLLLYLIFLYNIGFAKVGHSANQDEELYLLYQFLSGLSIMVLLNTFTMTGLFGQGNASVPIIIGLIWGCIQRKEITLSHKHESKAHAKAFH